MPEATAPPDKQKALAYKHQGNEAFAKKDWATAVGHYTAAHFSDPTEPTYPLNRAMAYIKLGKFLDAERDCTNALNLSPNSIKALYRRATAEMGSDKLELAVKDYEAVLRLDHNNAEAKKGLAKARQSLEKRSPPKKEPIDLRSVVQQSSVNRSSTSDFDTITQTSTATPKDSSSSVEAARKFLQQVGMSDDPQERPALPTSKSSTGSLPPPPKFPGETGGFLREVTTRKTNNKPQTLPDTPGPCSNTRDSSVATAHVPSTANQAPAPNSTSTTAKETASALNFGASSSQIRTAPTPSQAKLTPKASPAKLSSIDFHRKWKIKADRLSLLSSINPESMPAMIDAMLEPELVAEILQTLEAAHGSSSDDAQLNRLTTSILQALPCCKRFGMAVSMLDSIEKGYAARLIETVARPDLKAVWEVS